MSAPLQSALEVLAPHLDSKVEGQAILAAKSIGLMAGYDAKWRNGPFRIDDVEHVLTADLYNPETGRKSRTFTTAGKLDIRCTDIATGKKVIIDHKTTSESIDDPNSPYWRQLVVEGQASHYMLLEWLNGEKVDAAMWDVIKRPMIQPRALTKLEQAGLFNFGNYFDDKFESDEIEKVKADPAMRETPRLYAARLAHDCAIERPQWYFQRRMIPRLDGEIREYAGDQWDIAQDIIHARANKRWPRNSGACMLYHSPCKFLGVCSGYDTIDSEKWQRREWVHPELPIIGQSNGLDILKSNGSGVLTNSAMRTFQTCKKKFFYTYELGVERVEEEEKESIWFGNLFHEGLEQFFLALKREQAGLVTSL